MRVSQLFGETRRDVTVETEFRSHEYLLRGGFIRQLGAGIFSYLPLAQRCMLKVEQILREEMDAIGAQEVCMPVVHPAEIWQATGRWYAIGSEMVRFQDRAERQMVLAMTHEEVAGTLAASEVKSYKQLPLCIYQMQTKFRDEPRARGGLIRVREFVMKDSYSMDASPEGLHKQYVNHYNAYHRIMARMGLPVVAVGSDVGMMGGDVAHEFMYVTPNGEDVLFLCDSCGYAANREVASFVKDIENNGPAQSLEEVHTPDCKTIEDLANLLGVKSSQTAKAVLYMGTFSDEEAEKLVICIVRGDMELNQAAARNLAKANALRPATEEEIKAVGAVAGYASPIGVDRSKCLVLVDDIIPKTSNLIGGMNKKDYHYRNMNYGRDYEADAVGALAVAYEGAGCTQCQGKLKTARGVEVGNIFKLGTKYSLAFNAHFLDENGKAQPIIMGSYGIGVGRLFACSAEEHCDDKGLCFPISIAPYSVIIVTLGKGEDTVSKAEALYNALRSAGVEVLLDDRKGGAGMKFTDAELRGIPVRVTVSDRTLQENQVEIALRRGDAPQMIPYDTALQAIQDTIQQLWSELETSVTQAATWSE